MYFIFWACCVYYTHGWRTLHTSKRHSFQLFHGRISPMRKYPPSRRYYEESIRRLNSNNNTIKDDSILGGKFRDEMSSMNESNASPEIRYQRPRGIRIIINGNGIGQIDMDGDNGDIDDDNDDYENDDDQSFPFNSNEDEETQRQMSNRRKGYASNKNRKSENFEVVTTASINFTDIGGYGTIKTELQQCIDLLKNHNKYAQFNVRVPKGLIFEGPPGNGKTMIAKALAGEAGTGFIAVSGSEFQEKYVGVGASRIRELFTLAKKNIPCVIFIDEIDALGRRRSDNGELSASERDNTLNELLVSLDGFKNITGVFVIGATNRADLLDPALTRPGRIDKRIFIGMPDTKTREAILTIHLKGKPHDSSVILTDLVEQTNGLSGAQIENVLNEAMLYALRENREIFTSVDVEDIINKIMVGWQPTEHQFTDDIIDRIAIHEMGHAVVGMLSKNHANMTKVVINLSAPKSPAYTVFETSSSSLLTREALFEHLMILLAGRIAEEVVYGVSVTTGAINDFEEALKLAEKMILYYGMGTNIIYPSMSDTYKEMIDEEVGILLKDAYEYADFIVSNSKDFILEGAELLKKEKMVRAETLIHLMDTKYKNVASLQF